MLKLHKDIILLLVVFFVFVLYYNNIETFTNFMILPEQQNVVCAMSCCHHNWMTIDIDDSNIGVNKKDIGTKYLRTGIMCDNGISNGCICKLKHS